MNKLPRPTSKILEPLTQIRQVLTTSLYYLAVNEQGVGLAGSEFFKESYLKIVNNTMKDGEWFALECQHRPIFNKCDELYNLGFPLNGKD